MDTELQLPITSAALFLFFFLALLVSGRFTALEIKMHGHVMRGSVGSVVRVGIGEVVEDTLLLHFLQKEFWIFGIEWVTRLFAP